jgi:hypothetical protein
VEPAKPSPVKKLRHPGRNALARWLTRRSSPSEKRHVEWHFLFCGICQRQITVQYLADIAASAKKRLQAALRSAERN